MDPSTAAASRVRVVVRVRPLLAHEIAAGAAESNCVQCTESADGQPAVLLRDEQTDSFGKETNGETMLTFDEVYNERVSQQALFESEVLPHIQGRVFSGCTATLFAFGMSGTGKSHTMNGSSSQPGLIPRTVQHLFDAIQTRVASGEQEWETTAVNFSYFELYNEKIYDLLRPSAPAPKQFTDRGSSDSSTKEAATDLPVREDAHGKVFVANLSETRIDSYAAFASTYAAGMRNRKVASTKLNAHSSRAHTMILLKVEYRTRAAPHRKVTGRIQLLDLAGNEDNRYSGNTSSKSRMVESSKINNSLFVLGKVINALNAGDSRCPYRDSKLTRLLRDSMGGSNYAIMICNISPNPAHMAWTTRTLTFAMKSRQVVNTVERNVVEQNSAAAAQAAAEEERKMDLKAKLESWKREHGRAAIAPSGATAPTASSKARRVVSGAAPIATQKMDPSVLKKLNSLTNDVNSMKAALVLQQRQAAMHHPSTAHPSHAPSSSCAVPLTPASSANLARNSVEKAKVWEKNGQWSKALDEYREAARIRPGNEKLRLKIQQVEAKVARMEAENGSAQAVTTTLTGAKRARDSSLTLGQALKQRKTSAVTKAIPEESEESESDESDDESEASDSEEEEEASSAEEASDYDPADEDEDLDAVWMRRVKPTRATRRSAPSSQESSPVTSPTSVSLLQRITSTSTPIPVVESPVAAVTTKRATPTSRPTTALTKPTTVRTPLATISSQQKSIHAASPALPTKPTSRVHTPNAGGLVATKTSPTITKTKTSPTLATKGKENIIAASTKAVAPKPDVKVKPLMKVAPVAPLPIVAAPSLPIAAPGLLLSDLVSGRDNLLRLLNCGTLKELMELQTIGKKRAQLILSKREEMGQYVTLADLSHIGLSETQVESFTQRNLMSTVWNSAATQMAD